MKNDTTNKVIMVFFFICGVVWILCMVMDYITKHSNNLTTARSQPYTQQQSSNVSTYQAYSAPGQNKSNITSTQSTTNNASEPPYNLCKVRIENSFEGTDKTAGCKARMDSIAQTLTLSYIENPKEVIELTKQGGGLVIFRLYHNDELEATKTFYRRADLEGTNQYVYTSRTEQIKITIDYN